MPLNNSLSSSPVPCPGCGSTNATPLYVASDENWCRAEAFTQFYADHLHGPYVRCNQCGLWFVNPRPREADLTALIHTNDNTGYLGEWHWRSANDQLAARQLGRFVKGGRVLELGCGQGCLMMQLSAGFEPVGVDLGLGQLRETQRLTGRPVVAALAELLPFASGSLDAVVAMHLIEHVLHPRLVLQEAFRVLKPGGVLILETPDAQSALARRKGAKWWYLMSFHLTLWPRQTLLDALRETGFEPLLAEAPKRVWGLGYLAGRAARRSPWLAPLAALISATPLARLHVRLRPPDVVRVVAVKPGGQEPSHKHL